MRKLLISLAACSLLFSGAAGVSFAAVSDFEQGVALFKQGNAKEAVRYFERSSTANPSDPNAMYYKALCQQKLGNIPAAIQTYSTIRLQFPASKAAEYAGAVLDAVKQPSVTKPIEAPKEDPTQTKMPPELNTFEAANVTDEELAKLPDEARIPFTRGPNGHMFLSIYVNKRPIQVMFDTGASTCLFGKNHFMASGISAEMTSSKMNVGGVGSHRTAATMALVDLNVGGINRHMPVTVADNLPTPPLLGETFFNGYHYDIDNSAGIIHFVKKTAKKSGYTPYDTIDIPFEQVGNNMVVHAKVNGADCPMFFDTGAGGVVFSYFTAATIGLRIPAGSKGVVHGGVGGAAPGYEFTVDRLELGPIAKFHLPVTVLLTGGPPLPLLGQPFFGDKKFTIDNDKHVIKFVH